MSWMSPLVEINFIKVSGVEIVRPFKRLRDRSSDTPNAGTDDLSLLDLEMLRLKRAFRSYPVSNDGSFEVECVEDQ